MFTAICSCCLLLACGDDGDGDGDGDGESGDGSGSGGAGAVDCTDDEVGIPHVCQGAQVCCAVSQADNYCAADCEAGGIPIACDGPEDCGGNACCGTTNSSCADGPTCEGNDQVLCKTSDDCPSDVPCCFAYVLNGVTLHGCTTDDFPSCL